MSLKFVQTISDVCAVGVRGQRAGVQPLLTTLSSPQVDNLPASSRHEDCQEREAGDYVVFRSSFRSNNLL